MSALLQCVTCGKDVSSTAEKCPHCGEPSFRGDSQEQSKSKNAEYAEFHLFLIKGRVGRLRYFAYSMVILLLQVGILAIAASEFRHGGNEETAVVFIVMILAVFQFMLIIQRLHDFNLSGLFVILLLVPIANLFMLLALLFVSGTDGPNRFGLPSR